MASARYDGNRTISVCDTVPVQPSSGEVRIDVSYCGVCGTDMHIFHGAMDARVAPPQIIGHEASGVVAEVGEGVTAVKPGDRVAVRPLFFGGPAAYDRGHSHIGKNLKFIGIDAPGGMQSSWTVPDYTLHRLPESMPMTHGSMIEPAAVACHDVRLGEVAPGETVVVIGGGPIGLLIALVAADKGARVLLSEVNSARRGLAESLGLETIDPRSIDLVGAVTDLTDSAMADCVFEVSGSAQGAEAMTELGCGRGRIVMVAVHPEPKPVNLFRFFWSELRLIGARLYEPQDFNEAIQLAASGKLRLDRLITQITPIGDVQSVFEAIDASPDGVKYLIDCR
ncbi:zinc-dependent alcohol dehydrogenase [Botrimarina hoheduenensis]|uniref:Putative zinc-type alcohol dehydrogenase-like protein YjmD n=1 Tax=Botrimarina hoheduenensis TaxID=2528000 RepID=A0A5C5VPZ1_9BACT|nr:alcohol dehydrogenase catalytic domain-containing protein [Botrimarina hoheduenensis]TWT40676.1 putative zinc-type alcohol dehydrogenase-like protein YjmD [Botrimarina hoheduenensis]